jgi:hypothetical protein
MVPNIATPAAHPTSPSLMLAYNGEGRRRDTSEAVPTTPFPVITRVELQPGRVTNEGSSGRRVLADLRL